ncbi:hypothetical protein [Actinoplanes sp. M2I2]|uniref:hypothetical protein n=1 Tax=Actinoplanes sp. M2I2 TaxID=1734444 RepID=UPI00202174DC|nr:hypothetical protein [Actinoplanes sp. M2I2]
MIAIGSFVGFFVVQLPVLAVLVAGLVVLSSPARRLPGRSHQFARAGLIVLLAETLASIAWNIAFTQIVARTGFSMTQVGLAGSIVGFMLAVLFAAGLGLLIAAFATVRSFSSER